MVQSILIGMIEHYSLYEINKLTDRFGLTDGVPKGVKPRFNISPVQQAPVIVANGETTELLMMSYGLVPQGAKDANSVFRYKTFNVRSEKVFSKPTWENAVRAKRCIIPMNGFYMIRNMKDGDAYYFTLPSEELFGVAGICATWTDHDGVDRETYALLTIDASDAMPLPFAKMPVIIHDDDETKWLDRRVSDFSSLVTMMRPYEGSVLSYLKVSRDVTSPKLDSSRLIESV